MARKTKTKQEANNQSSRGDTSALNGDISPAITKKNSRLIKLPWLPPTKLSHLPEAMIILAYILFITFAPNWKALDSNTLKFFVLALVNIPAFLIIAFRKEYRQKPNLLTSFFRSNVGIVFTGFLLISLLSFTQAINLPEAIIHFARLFSVFMAVYVLSVILTNNLSFLKLIVVTMSVLLVIDSLAVFYFIFLFTQGDITSLMDIKFIYANKNIFASAIFVKMPFAIYMLIFYRRGFQIAGGFALALAIIATFFLASRVFFLGIFLFSIIFVFSNFFLYFVKKKTKHLLIAGAYIGMVMVGLLLFNYVQQTFYPESRDRRAAGIVEQLRLITKEDRSTYDRIRLYRWSYELIKENPLLGVGIGNWKVSILKYENQENDFFNYSYHAHNDFLENTVEKGIPGGLLFIAIFLMMFLNFWRSLKKTNEEDQIYAALFFASVGLLFYSIDAFVNFPSDRPEIQVLFILFLSTGIAAGRKQSLNASNQSKGTLHPLKVFLFAIPVLLVTTGASAVLYHGYKSAQIQRIAISELRAATTNPDMRLSPARRIVGQFPPIPTISLTGEPISTIEARYLMEEERYNDMISLLKNNNANPYDSRRELYLAMAYRQIGRRDSAMVYARKARELKPYNINVIRTYTGLLAEHGNFDRAFDLMDETEEQWNTWRDTPHRFRYRGFFSELQKIRGEVEDMQAMFGYYRNAMDLFENQNYSAAEEAFEAYFDRGADSPHAMVAYTWSLFNQEKYTETIESVNKFFITHGVDLALLNLRGESHRQLGDIEGACRDFRAAMNAGFQSAANNYRMFCQ